MSFNPYQSSPQFRLLAPMLFLLLGLSSATGALAEPEMEVVLFDSTAPSDANPARELNPEDRSNGIESKKGEIYLRESRDPYSDIPWRFSFPLDETGVEGTLVLKIDFLDRGAGLIRSTLLFEKGGEVEARRSVSCTRLNTGLHRSAWFEFDLSDRPQTASGEVVLEIVGLQGLRRLSVRPAMTDAEWEAAERSIPTQIEPMVKLDRPMQCVISAGAHTRGGPETLDASLDLMREYIPLAKVLGFTAIETYVRWNWVEPEEGVFDWSAVDRLVGEIRRHDLKWFPLLVVGSAYALPDWFRGGPEDVGFVCLEHGMSNPIQSIWNPHHGRHVTRFLEAFGEHYEPTGILEGVRLGPSGNYGESQYPAGGNWSAPGEESMHIHIGWWAGDDYAAQDYRGFLRAKYAGITDVNGAWRTEFRDWSEIRPRLPHLMLSPQERLDFTAWYTDSMSEWCDFWVREAGRAMPNTKIYQSAGGWGFREAGTDYTAQTKSMVAVNGGIRLTNETDSFEQNFFATRLAVTAARLYGVDLGFEPASSHTARGVAGRLFGTLAANGDHFFTYHTNLFFRPNAIARWLELAPLLDDRKDPLIEVAVLYPETANQLDDAVFRNLYAWGFNPRAREVRRSVEVDYLDERLIREGFLDRYKVLVHVWGDSLDAEVIAKIDAWIRAGGTLIYPSFPRGSLSSLDGDSEVFRKWTSGGTGAGAFHRFQGDMEPPSDYGDFVREVLLGLDSLHPWTKAALRADQTEKVFWSIQEDGSLLVLNYADVPGFIRIGESEPVEIGPFDIGRIPLE